MNIVEQIILLFESLLILLRIIIHTINAGQFLFVESMYKEIYVTIAWQTHKPSV